MNPYGGFIYTGGEFFTDITVTTRQIDGNPRTYSISLPPTHTSINITAEQANTLAHNLITALYDQNELTREIADKINHLTYVTMVDDAARAEAVADSLGEDF